MFLKGSLVLYIYIFPENAYNLPSLPTSACLTHLQETQKDRMACHDGHRVESWTDHQDLRLAESLTS